MVYFVRAKSYFTYAKDLLSALKKDAPVDYEKFRLKAIDTFKTALKAIWALTKPTAGKTPELEVLFTEVLETLSPEKKSKLKHLKSIVLDEGSKPDEVLTALEEVIKLVEEELKPIL